MALNTQVWTSDIKEKLFPSNSFMNLAINDDLFVENNRVNLANAGELPGVKRNRTTLPAAVVRRPDVDLGYDLDEFTSDPTLITNIDEVEVAYNKRQSVLKGHVDKLNLDIANWLLYHWLPTQSANIVRTTGATGRPAFVTGATGNRKPLILDNVMSAKNIADDMDLPEDGRVLLMPATMYNELVLSEKASLTQLQSTGEAVVKSGMLEMLLGFRIIRRGKLNVPSYTNAGTPVPRTPDAAALAAANAAALIWHPDFVRRALGMVKVFANEDDATMYGSVFSALVRASGQKAYSDETGVISIVETAA